MATSNTNKHLTLDERIIIENGIRSNSSKSSIADVLGKDKSTIGKEIKAHRILSHKFSLPLECAAYAKCKFGRHCSFSCSDFVQFTCHRRDRSPGACNGCEKFNHCRFNKYVYKAHDAHRDYRETLIDARIGVNLTSAEALELGNKIKPLLDSGQSPYQIILAHPELGICEKTLYSYIENGILSIAEISSLDLRRQVSRKIPKSSKPTFKKRQDKSFLKGRTYSDYLIYIEEHPNAKVVQMDTVYNNASCGPFIQTFKFIKYGLLFALYHDKKDTNAMLLGVNLLYTILGPDLFHEEVEVILTDRGTEFTCAEAFETGDNNTLRTRVFYCDPMRSSQKGSIENNHIELRYILPKETDLRNLGLTNQDKLNLALSHINSTPKEKLNGKSPIELTKFLCPNLIQKFMDFGIKQIEKDKVILKPHLLK